MFTSTNGSHVLIGWTDAVGHGTAYTPRAGTADGLSNIGSFSGDFLQAEAPAGAYFVRVIATSPCGASAPSADSLLAIGGIAPPPVPFADARVAGNTVTIEWSAVPGAAGYLLGAGTGPLLSNIAALPMASTGISAPSVPPGTYYLRVHAVGANGLSSTSRELAIVVP